MKSQTEVKKVMADAAQAGQKMIEDGAAEMRNSAENGVIQARATMEKGAEQVNKAATDMMKAAEDAAEFGRGNLEAVSKASQLYVTGMQDLSRQTLAMMQALSEHALEGVKTLATAKSVREAADFQASFAKTTFERAMNDTVKLQESALKVAEQSFAPLSARMTLAMEKMAKPVAA